MMHGAGDLDLVEQFLNTLDQRAFTRHGREHTAADELTSLEALTAWLQAHDLASADTALHPRDLDTAVALRTALRDVLGDASTSAPLQAPREPALSQADPTPAENLLARFPLRLVPDPPGRLRLAAATGVAGLDVIVETVAASAATGRWARLKLCAAPDCRWAFHDTSRSGAGRWCSMEICGNRHKTRSYRQRRSG
ncbi:hypothetical protein FHR75_004269 [Kineococcus radiotolerans]|uniref:Zinc finger CGNR domain-containing protein n=2 Tax=Kineococcus radiotolerans TaxID=131568 RepID=A0A7W4TQZ1_KINRA|nr:hypothetical protein [Kineococcus radiotolerans]